jgi:hypothetical protein
MTYSTNSKLLTQRELANRWGRSEAAIQMAAAVGVGPRYIKVAEGIRYPFEEIERYERACLFFEPADIALRTLN